MIIIKLIIIILSLISTSSEAEVLGWSEPLFYKTEAFGGVEVKVTSYQAVRAQTDDEPCIAASGYNVCTNKLGNVVAVSQDLLSIVDYYDDIILTDSRGISKLYTVVDCMNIRHKQRVDILSNQEIHGTFTMYVIKRNRV